MVPPLSHTWTVPLVKDMLNYARTGLTEAVAMGPGRAVLFYGRHSLGEGLSPGESQDTTFVLHRCHHCQTGLRAPSIPNEVDNVGRPAPT